MTNEEKLIQDAIEAIAKSDMETKKHDRILTMCFTSVEMSTIFLEHFEARIKVDYERAVKRIEAKCNKLKKKMTEEDAEYLRDKKKEYKRQMDYIAELKGALKKMDFHLKEARKQFVHLVEPKLNKVFFDKDRTTFNAEDYDIHGGDVYEMAEVTLKYFDATYMMEGHDKKVLDFIESLPGERVLTAEDYKRYNLRR